MMYKYKKKSYTIIILVIALFLLLFSKLNNNRNDNFWKRSKCSVSEPTGIVKESSVKNLSRKIDNEKGVLLESFILNGKNFKIAQYGCSSITTKFFIPIENTASAESKIINKEIYFHIEESLNKIDKVLKNRIAKRVDEILSQSIKNGKVLKYNKILYPKCDDGFCNENVVISSPINLEDGSYIPVKYIVDL